MLIVLALSFGIGAFLAATRRKSRLAVIRLSGVLASAAVALAVFFHPSQCAFCIPFERSQYGFEGIYVWQIIGAIIASAVAVLLLGRASTRWSSCFLGASMAAVPFLIVMTGMYNK